MTQKEKLEAEYERFPAIAGEAGVSKSEAKLSARGAQSLAEVLMRCPTADEARKIMNVRRTEAQAFWQVMEIVTEDVRAGKIRPGYPPMSANGPLAVLACTVLEYCETLEERLPDRF
jgi:hypothetical protein